MAMKKDESKNLFGQDPFPEPDPTKPKRRKLDADDLKRMNVPEEFWKSSPAEADLSVRVVLANYLANFESMMARGAGIYFTGLPGRGKTAAAVCLLKAAREFMRTGYFARMVDLRQAQMNYQSFDADTSIMERVREVDFLVIDGLVPSDFNAPYFNMHDLYEMIAARGQRRRPTCVTSLLTVVEVTRGKKADATLGVPALSAHPDFFGSLSSYLLPVEVAGPDRREAARADLRKLLLTPPKKGE